MMHESSRPPALEADAIRLFLTPQGLAGVQSIHILSSVDSTNAWLLERRDACGHLCLAEQQTAGRGRRGRVWQSPDSANVYMSLRWCFESVPPHYGWLGLVTGVAVARGLADYGLQGHQLKWPNDLYYQGIKLGGILLQTADPLQQVVIGIGINTGMQAELATGIDQPWCDLATLLGETVDRNRLIAAIINHLIPALQGFAAFDASVFLREWAPWDLLNGQPVQVDTGRDKLQGVALGLDAQGQLRVRLADGNERVFSSADVSVRQVL